MTTPSSVGSPRPDFNKVPSYYSLHGSIDQYEELGHRMTPFREGVAYCLRKDCGATCSVNGSLPDLVVEGTAMTKVCPSRG